MPKLKTHSGAKKRFKLSKTGKVIRAHANKSHILNKKDFIFDKRQNCDNKDRLDGICRINKLFGYCEEVGDKVYTSKPITLVEINKKLKINGKFGILNQNDDKIKGRTIL